MNYKIYIKKEQSINSASYSININYSLSINLLEQFQKYILYKSNKYSKFIDLVLIVIAYNLKSLI